MHMYMHAYVLVLIDSWRMYTDLPMTAYFHEHMNLYIILGAQTPVY